MPFTMSSPSPPQRPHPPGAIPRAPMRAQQRQPLENGSWIPPNPRKRTTVSPMGEDRQAKKSKSGVNGTITDSSRPTQPLPPRYVAVAVNEPPYTRDRSREFSQRPESGQGQSMFVRQDTANQPGRKPSSPAAPSTQISRPRTFSHSASPESDHGSQCNPILLDSDSDDFESIMTGRITGQKPVRKTASPVEGQGARKPGGDLRRLTTPDKTANITARIAAKFAAKHELDRSQRSLVNGTPIRLNSTTPVIKKEDESTPQREPPRARTPTKSPQQSTPTPRISGGEPAWVQNGPWSKSRAREKEIVGFQDKDLEAKKKEQEGKAKAAGQTNALPSKAIEKSSISRPSQPRPRSSILVKENRSPIVADSRRSWSYTVKRNSSLDSHVTRGASENPGRDGGPGIVRKDTESGLFVRNTPPVTSGGDRSSSMSVDIDELFGEGGPSSLDTHNPANLASSSDTTRATQQPELGIIPSTPENGATTWGMVPPSMSTRAIQIASDSMSGPTPVPAAVLPSPPSSTVTSGPMVALAILPKPTPSINSTLHPASVLVREPPSTPAPKPTLANGRSIHSISEAVRKLPEKTDPPAPSQTVEIVRGPYNTPEKVREKRLERESREELRLKNEKTDQEALELLRRIKEIHKKRDANRVAQAEQDARTRAAEFVESPAPAVSPSVPSASSAADSPLRPDGRPRRTWGVASTPASYAPISKSAKSPIKPRATGPKKVTFAETQQTAYYQQHSPVREHNRIQQRNSGRRQQDESDISDEDEDEDDNTQKNKPILPQNPLGAPQGRCGTLVVRSPQGKPATNGHISSGGSNHLALSSVRRPPIEYPVSAPIGNQSPQHTSREEIFYEYRVIRTSWRDDDDPPLIFHCGTYYDRESANTAARKQIFPSNEVEPISYDEFHMEKDANGMDLFSADTPECHIIVYTELVLRKAEYGPKPDSRAKWLNPEVYIVYEKCVIFEKRARDDEDDLFDEHSDEEDIKTENMTLISIHYKRDLANQVAAEHMLARLKQHPDGSKNNLITDVDQALFDEAEGNSRKELQALEKAKTYYEGTSSFYGSNDEITVWVKKQDVQGPLN